MPENRRIRAVVVGTALALLVTLFSVDYTVQRGDTLGRIAKDHGVSLTDLVEANNVANPNLIRIGQVLVIPGAEAPGEGDEPDSIHVVARGDTLGRIAYQYGTSVTVLVEANGITNPNLIRIGQTITVPGSFGGNSSTTSVTVAAATDTTETTDTTDTVDAATGGVATTTTQDPTKRSGAFHVVKKGEKLDTIAALYGGVTAEQLARANGILNGTVYSGTRLWLDGPSFVGAGVEGERTYEVKKGDRLGDIAAAHGTTITKLSGANNISDPNLIRAGQNLLVPGGAAWVCPVEGSRFFNDWGFPRSGGRYHAGNDLFAPYGTPIYAPVSGSVLHKTGPIGGMQFNLSGDDGVMYIGSHMSDFAKEGQVSAGDVVGFIGDSGNAVGTSPHVHFGMYLNGYSVNPYPSLIANGCK